MDASGRAPLTKSEIVARLREIAALLKLRGASTYKVRAFERGARALEATKRDLDAFPTMASLEELAGIGSALAHQIEEMRSTGSSDLLRSLREGLPPRALELSQAAGVGLHALRVLHDELGIRSIDDLEASIASGRLRAVRGFGEKREARVLRSIERYRSTPPPVRLAEGLRLAESLADELAALPGVLSVHLAGALRRFEELSPDVCFVVESAEPAVALEHIASAARIASVEERDARRLQVRLADGTRVHVHVAPPEELATRLVHATATDAHWRRLVERADRCGRRLAPVGLFDGTTPTPLHDEAALYRRLGLATVPVEMRDDHGEVERAERDGAFDLVEGRDVLGLVHCHTTWSDGKATIEEMARAAEALGARYITITDHSPAAHYAGGLDVERLKRQTDEIAEVQDRVGIRILRGSEVDILADGALDLPDAVLESLDVVIASIHDRHKQDEAQMTARVIRAMRHPIFKIWGHPMGRLVPHRPPIPLRVDEVFDAMADAPCAFEVSGDPARLDLAPDLIRRARRRGIPAVLSVDAHSVAALHNLKLAVGLSRRGGLRKSEVLNTLAADAFARAVRPAA